MDDQSRDVGDISGLIADNQNEPFFVEPATADAAAALAVGTAAGTAALPADATIAMDDTAGGDVLDLAQVLTGTPDSDNIDNYLLAISNGSSSTLLVDTGGNGDFANPDLVLEIGGVNWDSSISGQLSDLVLDAVIIV